MTHIYARVQDQILTATIAPRLACNNRNTVKLHVEFDDSWDAISGRSAVFTTSVDPTPYEIVLSDGVCTVPHEVLTYEGHLFISIIGVNSSADLIKSTMPIMYKVLPGTPAMIVSTPTADVYHQLLTHLAIMQARLNNAESAVTVDSEVQDIRVGADGTTYDTAGEAVRAQIGNLSDSTSLHDLPTIYYSGINNRSKPLFIIDATNGSITLGENAGYLFFNFNNTRFECNASDVSIDNVWNGQTAIYIYFNKLEKKFLFRPTPYKDTLAYFIGYIINDIPSASRCDVPFIFNGRYYNLFKNSMGRERASLVVGVQAEYKAKVDFKNKKLIFPYAPIIISNNGWTRLDSLYPSGCELSFATEETDTYHYLVGDEVEGLKFITANEFQKYSSQYYFGWVRDGAELFDLNCRAEKVKTLSILGDSISTFTGYIPEGNAVYYNGSNYGVSSVDQTWWKRLVNTSGYVVNMNNSWSGSRVTTTSGAESSGITRATLLDNGTNPDTIIVWLGINDFNNNVALGTFDGKGKTPTSTTTFREAYAIMLKNILSKYKTSKVYVCTLLASQRNDDFDDNEYNGNGVYLSEFNNAIREIADAYCVEVIDLATCGITNYNASLYMGDYSASSKYFLHPNANGHKLIADKIYKSVKGE